MSTVNIIMIVDSVDIKKRSDAVANKNPLCVKKNDCKYILNIISVGDMDVVNITYNRNENKMNINEQLFSADKFYVLISHYKTDGHKIKRVIINNKEIKTLATIQNNYICKWCKPLEDAEIYFCSIQGYTMGRIYGQFEEKLISKITC